MKKTDPTMKKTDPAMKKSDPTMKKTDPEVCKSRSRGVQMLIQRVKKCVFLDFLFIQNKTKHILFS